MRSFREYKIWQESFKLVVEIYSITSDLPKTEKFGLISQMNRAAVSIPSNIAEGCSRSSDLEFKRFLEIALGSANELETQILISEELKLLQNTSDLIDRLQKIQASINSLIQKLKQ